MDRPFAIAVLTVLVSATPARALDSSTPASVFDVSGSGLHVTYTAAGSDGQPHLEYASSERTLSFAGSEIRTVSGSDLGTLVSVTIWRTVDAGATSFTLVLPPVRLATPDAEVNVEVLGITTAHRFSVIPRLRRGQLSHYADVVLTGTARATPTP